MYLYPIVKSISEVVIKFEEAYENKKREKGIIDFNNIEHFALEILTTNGEPSDIAINYRDKFYEIFIDEYQDSNLVQEVLLNAISKIDTPNRFMVGDVKQSIYRFRQAKPEIFLEKYREYGVNEGNLYRKIMLYKNFRSREEIVDCANYIFENIMSENIGEIEYTQKERLNLGANFKEVEDLVGGPTDIHLIQKNTKTEEDEEEIDNIQLEARMVGKIIKDLIDEDFKVYDKKIDAYRTVEYKDIVILLRATSMWAPAFADELMNMDIPTYADIGVGYFETLEIKTILSLLQVIDNPMQDIALIAVLKSPIFGFTPEELIDIRISDSEKSFYEAVENIENEKCIDFLEKLKDFKEKSLYMSTDEFLWYLYTTTGYYAYVGALPGGVQRQANLKILFERAKQFEETSFKGIFNFINFIMKLKKSNTDMGSAKTLGENANVVRIMSIHKSKGLEFPVVICSGMGKNFNTQDFKNNILYHHKLGYGPQLVDFKRRISYPSIAKEALKTRINIENLSEEMRVLYVAFTRPKEKLIITGSTKDIDSSLNKWVNSVDSLGKVAQYEILKGKNYLDWIMPSVLKHKDLENIRENVEVSYIDNHKSKWRAKLWDKSDIIIEKKDEEENIDDVLKNIELDKDYSDFSEIIKEKLDYKYKYEDSTKKPSSISVTEIKKIQEENDEDYSSKMFERKTTIKQPLFLQEVKKFDSAQRGTITHLIMEILDLNKVDTIENIKSQIENFILKNIITKEQAKVIDSFKIYKFFKSSIGKRMLKADFIKREQAIYLDMNIKDVYNEVYDDLSIMLRGIIDAYFEEDGEIILIDYKTDYVTEENKDEIVKKYEKQVNLYANALQTLTGKKVKEKYIYLFRIDKEILV
jgi:ATP-dependent helicase/nuclease subunit A